MSANVKMAEQRLALISKLIGDEDGFRALWLRDNGGHRNHTVKEIQERWPVLSNYDVRGYALSLGLPSRPGPLPVVEPEPEPVGWLYSKATASGPGGDTWVDAAPALASVSDAVHFVAAEEWYAERIAELVAVKLEARLTRKAKRGLFGGRHE